MEYCTTLKWTSLFFTFSFLITSIILVCRDEMYKEATTTLFITITWILLTILFAVGESYGRKKNVH